MTIFNLNGNIWDVRGSKATKLKERKTMIECSLQEAIKRCRENGGIIRKKHATTSITQITLFKEKYIFTPDDILADWIYEPPKQSAFQKWDKTEFLPTPSKSLFSRLRKEGWNAALDEVLKVTVAPTSPDRFVLSGKFLQELKEP